MVIIIIEDAIIEKKVKAIASKEDRSIGVIVNWDIGDAIKNSIFLMFNKNIINITIPLKTFNLNIDNLAIDIDAFKYILMHNNNMLIITKIKEVIHASEVMPDVR